MVRGPIQGRLLFKARKHLRRHRNITDQLSTINLRKASGLPTFINENLISAMLESRDHFAKKGRRYKKRYLANQIRRRYRHPIHYKY
jgi:hypothetical protein